MKKTILGWRLFSNKDKRFDTPDELEMVYNEDINDINLNDSGTGIGHLPLRWALVNQTEGEYTVLPRF